MKPMHEQKTVSLFPNTTLNLLRATYPINQVFSLNLFSLAYVSEKRKDQYLFERKPVCRTVNALHK